MRRADRSYALEGGYDLVALPWCVRRTLELLLGIDATQRPARGAPPIDAAEGFDAVLESVKRLHGL